MKNLEVTIYIFVGMKTVMFSPSEVSLLPIQYVQDVFKQEAKLGEKRHFV